MVRDLGSDVSARGLRATPMPAKAKTVASEDLYSQHVRDRENGSGREGFKRVKLTGNRGRQNGSPLRPFLNDICLIMRWFQCWPRLTGGTMSTSPSAESSQTATGRAWAVGVSVGLSLFAA